MSAGALLLTFGDNNGDTSFRFIAPYARLMFHSASVVVGGKLPETKETLSISHEQQIALFEKASLNMKKKKNWLTSNLNKRKDYDWELTADEVEAEKIGMKYVPTFMFRTEEFYQVV